MSKTTNELATMTDKQIMELHFSTDGDELVAVKAEIDRRNETRIPRPGMSKPKGDLYAVAKIYKGLGWI